MANKQYSPSLKAKWDKLAKDLTEKVMSDLINATKVTDNIQEDAGKFTDGFWDQKYVYKNGKTVLVEAEMKDEKWWGEGYGLTGDGPFKFDTMDIPYRKAKNKANIFMLFSTDGQFGFVVTRKAMDEAVANLGGPKMKNTIYTQQEGFFSVPLSKGFFAKKGEDGRWRRWVKPGKESDNGSNCTSDKEKVA